MMAGRYDNSRRMDSSFFSLLNLFGAVKVVANDDDTIGISMVTNLAGAPMKWREIEPFVWRQTEGKQIAVGEGGGRPRGPLQLRRRLALHDVRAGARIEIAAAG